MEDRAEYDRQVAIERIRACIALDPIFLDTETTGLQWESQVVDLAVVDMRGVVLLNTLVNPTIAIDPDATMIHHINGEDVAGAPTFDTVLSQLEALWAGRTVVVYNSFFDRVRMMQSALARGVPEEQAESICLTKRLSFVCAMKLYARYYGQWNYYHRDYKWQKLGDAAEQCGLAAEAESHRALADAQMARRVFLHMAES